MNRRRAGRPGKADLAERKGLKAEAAAHDCHREWMESQIKQGRVEVLSLKEYFDRMDSSPFDPLDNVLIAAPPLHPALQFLVDRLQGVPAEKFEGAMLAALLDLLAGDVTLDREDVRSAARTIAELMKRTPKERRLAEDRAFIDVVAMLKQHLAGRGLTMEEAEGEIATTFGWKNRNTLLRMLQKAKTRLRGAAAE
jgi:hypothetical protein